MDDVLGLRPPPSLLDERVGSCAERPPALGAEPASAADLLARIRSRHDRGRDPESALTPEQEAFRSAAPRGRGAASSAAPAPARGGSSSEDAEEWRWVAVDAGSGKMLETAQHEVAVFRRSLAAAKWAAAVAPALKCEVRELATDKRARFEREVRWARVSGDAEDELAADLAEDPMWVEFRRQHRARRRGATEAEEHEARRQVAEAEAAIARLDAEADEAEAEAEMHELALVEMFKRCQELEAAAAAHDQALKASRHGPALLDAARRLAEQRHPAAAPDADPRRLAAAARNLLYPDADGDAANSWEPPPPPLAKAAEPPRAEPRPELEEEEDPQQRASWTLMADGAAAGPWKRPPPRQQRRDDAQPATRVVSALPCTFLNLALPYLLSSSPELSPPAQDALLRAAERRRNQADAAPPPAPAPAPAPAPPAPESPEVAQLRAKLEAAAVRNAPKAARALDDQEIAWADMLRMFGLNGAEGLHRMLTTVPGLTAGACGVFSLLPCAPSLLPCAPAAPKK